MDFFDGLAYYFFILIPVSVKKQLGSGFRGLLDPESDFWPDPDSMQCCGAGPTLTGTGSGSREKNFYPNLKKKNSVLKNRRR